MSRIIDTLIVFRTLKMLTTKWTDFDAYKLGIIDKKGARLYDREVETSEDKQAYTLLHRLVFNLKRIIQKVPFGKSAFASYAIALLLLKEETKINEDQMEELCEKFYRHLKDNDLVFMEQLTEAADVPSVETNKTYRLRRPLKQQNETVYPEKMLINIHEEHSNIFGMLVYIGYIGEDRVLVTGDDIY